ncbi:MAG: C1 family peptidase [Candidatus Wallbacteria bacterium]|nr:C1 family peptidase [Candidatus Wallbacteria bacterium]
MKRAVCGLLISLTLTMSVSSQEVGVKERAIRSKNDAEFQKVLDICKNEKATYTVDRNTLPDDVELKDLAGASAGGINRGPAAPLDRSREVPSHFDWTEKACVTSVKYQGNCGSCWAFACAAVVEAGCLINEHKNIDLSEQDLISCNSMGFSCKGGNYMALTQVMQNGLALEQDLPYQGVETACTNVPRTCRIKMWYTVSSDVDSMKSAIMQYGPIYTHLTVDSNFQFYSGGIYNHDATEGTQHAIVIIGWNDQYQSWIIKNSWGDWWGIRGMAYVQYGKSGIGNYSACIDYNVETIQIGTVSSSDGVANVRSGPGTNYSILTALRNGTQVKVLSLEGNWYRVTLDDGRTGYIYSNILKVN